MEDGYDPYLGFAVESLITDADGAEAVNPRSGRRRITPLTSHVIPAAMDGKIAVISGTGIEMEGGAISIDTPFGRVEAKVSELEDDTVLFIPRHGRSHLPPHRVNYRALLWAAKGWGALRAISTNTVGTMSWHPVGSFVVPRDFVELTRSRPSTFFEEEAVHVDLTTPYCPEVRRALVDGAKAAGATVSGGVYVCTEGPHLESPAQIRMLRRFGDVVGMTGYPEVALAREMELCYASICIVTNTAAGMRKDAMAASEITGQMERSSSLLMEIIAAAASKMPEERGCRCGSALTDARL